MEKLSLSDRGKSTDISAHDIKAIEDFGDAFEYADRLGVSLEGLDDLEEMKERLILEIEKLQPGYVNFKAKICREMKDRYRDDYKKRGKLLELLAEVQSKLTRSNGDFTKAVSIIEESLQTEGVADRLSKDLSRRQQYIKKGECCFVVAGETSAGKSLFLNLLLGVDILPSSHQACTSVITKLAYGVNQDARIVFHDESREDVIFENVRQEDIRHLVYEENLSKRESTSDIKEVQIHLPSEILQSGLVLVDSPGIGENDDMDKVIEEFVEANHVMGFIYIIKSDNGGGVDEDRLIRLMRIILQKEKTKSEKGSVRFHPGCAMFICNVWDNVTEEEKVYKHITGRLGKIWPHFTEEKVLRFSTKCANREVHIDEDYITSAYRNVLSLLENVYNEALNERIKRTYRWITHVLQRSVHHLKIIVRQLNDSDDRLDGDTKDAYGKLEKLKNESAKVVAELRELVKRTSEQLCVQFREHLKSPVVRMGITQWIEPELPDGYRYENGQKFKKDWMTLKAEIDGNIVDRIAGELDRWEEEKGTINELEFDLVSNIQQQLFGFTNDIRKVEHQLDSSTSSKDSTNSHSVSASVSSKYRRESVCTKFYEQQSIGKDMFELSSVARNKIFQPLKSILGRMKPGNNKWDVYVKDKVAYATMRSSKLLKRFTDPDKVDQMQIVMKCFMEKPKNTLDKLILEIPNLIRANQNLICHVSQCKRESSTSLRVYEEMMKDFEILKRTLAEYGEGHIFVDDFRPDELQVLDPTDATGRSSAPFKISELLGSMSSTQKSQVDYHPTRALWTAHQKGILNREEGDEPVIIKIYVPCCKIRNSYQEIAKLRLLDHKNLADFLGIQNSDSYHPALVYRGHLRTLRHHLANHRTIDISLALEEILNGIEYLHKNGLVHMELNSNTVMVNCKGTIRMTGGCLPRTADIPVNTEQHVCGDFVHLSPEVLKGDLYISSADVYAFGLLLLEILFGFNIFEKQRKTSLDIFIHSFNPNFVMEFEDRLESLSEETRNFIISCLNYSEGSRPTVSKMLENLPFLDLESANGLIKSDGQFPRETQKYSKEASRF